MSCEELQKLFEAAYPGRGVVSEKILYADADVTVVQPLNRNAMIKYSIFTSWREFDHVQAYFLLTRTAGKIFYVPETGRFFAR